MPQDLRTLLESFLEEDRLNTLEEATLLSGQTVLVALSPSANSDHPGHLSLPASFNNLATPLRLRFRYLHEIDDYHQNALALLDPTNPDRHATVAAALDNFATALYHRFKKSGQRYDIHQALLYFKKYVPQHIPAAH